MGEDAQYMLGDFFKWMRKDNDNISSWFQKESKIIFISLWSEQEQKKKKKSKSCNCLLRVLTSRYNKIEWKKILGKSALDSLKFYPPPHSLSKGNIEEKNMSIPVC